jgi:predicted DNA-binding ribbon-helix-helix protein
MSDKRSFHAPEGYKRLTINLKEDVHKKIKFMAVNEESTVTQIIEKLLEKEIAYYEYEVKK